MGLHRYPDPAMAPGPDVLAEPLPVCGAWYGDGWISPYLRLSLPENLPHAPLRLHLGLYCPGTEAEPMAVLLRLGPGHILLDAAVPPGELCRWDMPLDLVGPGAVPDLILRTGRTALSGEGDLRRLGLVMTDCTLTAFDHEDPAGPSTPPAGQDRISTR